MSERPGYFGRFRHSAALNYLVMTVAGLLVYFLIMSARGNDAGVLIALILAIGGIVGRWTAAPALVLLLTVYMLIDPGFMNLVSMFSGARWVFLAPGGGIDPEVLILAAAILAYVIGHYRLMSLVHQGMPDEPTVQSASTASDLPRRAAESVDESELPRALAVGAACVVVGQLAWFALIGLERLSEPRVFDKVSTRFLILAWVVGLGAMLVTGLLVYLRAIRMSRREAELVLRDEFFHETRRELDRVQRWRKWFKLRAGNKRPAGK